MLRAYIDESGLGKNRNEGVCCVAGFAADNSQWKTFGKAWERLLDDYRIDEFHSKEFWARKADGALTGKYAHLSFGDANELLSKITRLIHSYNLMLIGAAVDLNTFFSYTVAERKFLTGATYDLRQSRFTTSGKPSAAYFVAFNTCVSQTVRIAAAKRDIAHFVFDEQDEFSPYALKRLADMRANLRIEGIGQHFGDAVFACSARVMQLQAADLAAFTCKEYYKREFGGRPIDFRDTAVLDPLEVMRDLLEPDNHKIFRLGRKEMRVLLAGMVGVGH